MKLIRKVRLRKEHTMFIVFLAIILALTPFLMDLLVRSWNTGLMKSISGAIKLIYPSGISIIINIVLGFYVGSIILLFRDRYKRIQAIFLSIGITIVSQYLFRNFDITWDIIPIVIGIAIGIILGARSLKIKNEFRHAANNLSLFSIFYVIIAFLIIYISSNYSGKFIIDAFTVLGFSYFFGKLMNYESPGLKIFVLGPQNSGKTMFFAGCYLRALAMTEIPLRPTNDLLDVLHELHSGHVPWPARTGGISVYQFTYETGLLFPRKTTMRTIDYPGIFVENLYDKITVKENLYDKYIKKDTKSEEEKRYARTVAEITNADTLIFIIDAERYPNFGDMGIIHYIKILNKLHESGKDIKPYIIITKSDLFMDEFGNKEDYDGFKKFIEEKFTQNMYLRELLNEATNASLFPVFYYVKQVPGERPVPMRDDHGNVYTYGYDHFMDYIMETE